MTRKCELHMAQPMFDRLMAHLFPGDGDGHGVVIQARLLQTADGPVVPARTLVLAEEGQDWVPGNRGYRMMLARFVARQAWQCRDEKLVHLAVHNHGGRDERSPSPASIWNRTNAASPPCWIGIIGLGGVGSLMAELLVHPGVGAFILVDPDRVQPSNVSRHVDVTEQDAMSWMFAKWVPGRDAQAWRPHRTRKIDLAARVIHRANRKAHIERFHSSREERAVIEALKTCDYIIRSAEIESVESRRFGHPQRVNRQPARDVTENGHAGFSMGSASRRGLSAMFALGRSTTQRLTTAPAQNTCLSLRVSGQALGLCDRTTQLSRLNTTCIQRLTAIASNCLPAKGLP